MTGLELYTYFLEKVQSNYTGYLSTVEANRLFKQALYQAIDNKYRNLAEQREYDNLTGVIKTEAVYTPVGNQLTTTSTGLIPDYNHLLSIKATFTVNLFVSLEDATNTTPIRITTATRTNLRTGDHVTISGVIGNTNANGTFYLRKVSDFGFQLYSDEFLQNAVSGNAAYISGGAVSRIYDNYCTMIRSDEKIGILAQATVDYPKYETAENRIKIYPANQVCQSVTMDYITTAVVVPDVSNSTTDLELTYPFQFLQYLVTVAAEIYSGEVKDTEQQRSQEIDLSQNT